jgi:GNAT superfamily N-acetyltransferase
MVDVDVVARVREMWCGLAGVPLAFPAAGTVAVAMTASPDSRLCPSGWAGIVVIDGAGIATVAAPRHVEPLRRATAKLSADEVVDPDALREVLPLAGVLGPAAVGYVDAATFRPVPSPLDVRELPAGHADLDALYTVAGLLEREESGVGEVTSPVWVVYEDGAVVAACGYAVWPGSFAHVSVLTAPAYRRRGLARVVASAAVVHALRHGMLPQWRAAPMPSRRVAHALGFRRLGTQLSVRIAD